jgi:hypothetical protein
MRGSVLPRFLGAIDDNYGNGLLTGFQPGIDLSHGFKYRRASRKIRAGRLAASATLAAAGLVQHPATSGVDWAGVAILSSTATKPAST